MRDKPSDRLRGLLGAEGLIIMPCCYDAFSARLIQQAGFPLTFMSGFAVSAARLGLPDTGLISYAEMLDQGRNICSAVDIPVIGDADTGYGNALNVRRTVRGYAEAGFACAMIEDQEAPKRCGHTDGKRVVDFHEACRRIQAAVDERESGSDILIMARTDAHQTLGMQEALARCRAFSDLGADILFLEAPQSIGEMEEFCSTIPGHKMANLIDQGVTPVLPPQELESMGFKIAAYPLTLISAAAQAMRRALADLQAGVGAQNLIDFAELRDIVGYTEYDRQLGRYTDRDD